MNASNITGLRGAALALLAGTLSLPAAAQDVVASDAQGDYYRGRIIVAPRAGVDASEVSRAMAPHGGRARALGASGLYVVTLPSQASETAVVQQLANNPRFKFAELDRRFKMAFTPNDPYFGSQWHTAKINAPAAWDIAQGDGVTIAILDTGVDGTHPDLAGQLVPGWNFYNNNSDASDPHGHGTGVAGVAAAALNNAAGVAALAGRAKIMPIRISDPYGYASASTVAQAITYVADKGVRIASMSFDGMAGNQTVQTAAQYLKSKNGLFFVAAGNNARDEGIATTTTMIPVSATDENDALTSFSSWGSYVALSAPGINVASTKKGGTYSYWYGTSVAAPLAAGTAALMMSAKPGLSAAQVESLLYSTAVDLGSAGRDKYFGYGRIDVGAAVRAASGAATIAPDTTAPALAISSPGSGSTVSGVVAVNVAASDNTGVTRVELRVNGSLLATDTASPFSFAWDTTKLANGTVTLSATAFDAAGNSANSGSVSVGVSNASLAADSTPPVLTIVNPTGGTVKGSVSISTSASDNSGAPGITQMLYIDGVLKATATGATLSSSWNTRKASPGVHTIQVVARDAAGNSTTKSVQVTK